MPASGKKYFMVGSLEKGLQVIELLAEKEPLSVSQVGAALEINRSASHRFLATLRELGYVEKDEEGKYRLTFRMLEQGMKSLDRFEIRRTARPFLQRLSVLTHETVNLGFWDGQSIIHLDKIDSQNILRMDSRIGSRAEAYCTALGKAILAWLPEEELTAYLEAAGFEPHGPNTLEGPAELRVNLLDIRNKGYAVDDEEMAPGLRCLAAPVFDFTGFPRYALSISGPATRVDFNVIGSIEADLRQTCEELSTVLGKPGQVKRNS
jgi:DNA-binding IclR family transcriptional regulator